ncbi:MAG: T9SS type A sorting domain-containing protein [Saprospiraceae bacterium]|nr:T9SS type A sorting domain-containing protein [Saprospiraceae bacterium]
MTNSVSAQDEISCDDQVNVSVGADCMFTVAAGLFTEGPNDGTMVHFSTNPVTTVAIGADVLLECGTYTVTVEDASGNSCWGTVVVEDKLPPVAEVNPCPADVPCVVDCFDYADGIYDATAQSDFINPMNLLDCSLPVQVIGPTDVYIPADICTDPDVLLKIYSFVDAKGNVGADTLHYLITKHTLQDIMTPPTFEGDCDSPRCPGAVGGPAAPSVLVDGMVVELGPGAFQNDANCSSGTAQVCDILISYEDIELPACDASCSTSKKIIRNWTYLDWCEQVSTPPAPQIIHLKDNTPPTITGTTGETKFSVDPWLCLVEELPLPTPTITDNCDMDGFGVTIVGPAGVVIQGGVALNVPKGTHVFTYYATDCCGNVSAGFPVTINVWDGVAPVAIAKQFSVISLSNVPGENEGIAKMFAPSLDNGSYDRCTDVHLEIRRDGYYATGGDRDWDLDYLNDNAGCGTLRYPCDVIGNDTYDNTGHSWDIPNGCNSDIDPDRGEYVKFCCADLEAETVDVNYDGVLDAGYVKVWLRVWDNANMSMDAQGNPIYGDVVDGKSDYYNETWGYVKVEVSKPPTLTVVDETINCDWPYQQKFDEGYYLSDEWLAGHVTTSGICDVDLEVELDPSNVETTCPGGYFTLIYTATNPDSKGLHVVEELDVYIDDLNPLYCDDINWPPSYSEVGCTELDGLVTLDWHADACDLIGWTYRTDTFRFESGACLKIINEYTVIDWCAFDRYYDLGGQWSGHSANGYFEGGHDYLDGLLCEDPVNWPDMRRNDGDNQNGVYKYIEVIKVIDEEAPVITAEDAMYAANSADCDTEVTLDASATDASDGPCPLTWFKWEITIDWDHDGDFEDETPYTENADGSRIIGDVIAFEVWDQNSNPRVPRKFEGPMGSYDVRYIVYDGCGNVDKEIRNIMIVDKKAPTPYCVSLSSALMANNQVELWARDFNVGSTDNCTHEDDLLYTFNEENPVLTKLGEEHYFKGAGEEATEAEYLEGDAQLWRPADNSSARIFDCDDYAASPIDVRMTVWDEKLNYDWCSVELTLVNNQGDCDGAGARAAVSGNIATEENSDVSQVEVTLENLSNPEYELTVSTGNDGDFAFASNPMYNGYDISAVKDGDDTEGVSTLDLVLIQRHILGITSFDSPYKVIAADINSDRRVSGTDLVVLRKTILGIYKEFPTNNSWRFVEKAQTLTVDNALTDFNEVINIQDLDANMLNEDFTAVKIGDVNATAKTNARDLGTQTRSAGTITIGLEEQNVTEGQLVDLTFSTNDFNKVYGYQFTLELNGLTIESVESGDANMSEANIGILDENTVTVSYSDMEGLGTSNNLFTLSAVATQSGTISNMISLTNSVLNSEGYVGEGLDIHTVDLTINGEDAQSFRLDQNEPNPFDEVTVVGFELPSSGNATLTVYDVAGKIVTTVRGAYAQGYNEIKLNKEDLNTTGVLYYTLKSGEFSATKKMIIIE